MLISDSSNIVGSSSGDPKASSSDFSDGDIVVPSKDEPAEINADFKRVVLMGIALKLGGCVLTWNWGLGPGFWECLFSVVSIGLGYITLGLCMAEIVSIMTFDGGYYGYARVILGPLGGYLIGCSGLIESVFAFSGYALKISHLMQTYYDIPEAPYDKYGWILCYVGVFLFNVLFTGKLFWNVISFVAIVEILLILFYLFSSMPYLNFQENALQVPDNGSGWEGKKFIFFFNDFRLGLVFFNSFDLLTLTSSEVKNAKKSMPRALISVICIMFVLAIWLLFTVPSQSPGQKALLSRKVFFPLAFGFQDRLGLSYKDAMMLAALPIFCTFVIYFYLTVKQIIAMASSNLLPGFLLWSISIPTWQPTREKLSNIVYQDFPILAYLTLCFAGFGANSFIWTVNVLTSSSRMAGLASCFVYLAMFYCYIIFKQRYGHMERNFTNPLGYFAPLYGSIVFLFLLIVFVAFDLEFKNITIFYTVYMGVMLVYYYLWVESHQKFSLKEQQVFFKAYIVKSELPEFSLLLSFFFFTSFFPFLLQCIFGNGKLPGRSSSMMYLIYCIPFSLVFANQKKDQTQEQPMRPRAKAR
jgi:amino acid transporter